MSSPTALAKETHGALSELQAQPTTTSPDRTRDTNIARNIAPSLDAACTKILSKRNPEAMGSETVAAASTSKFSTTSTKVDPSRNINNEEQSMGVIQEGNPDHIHLEMKHQLDTFFRSKDDITQATNGNDSMKKKESSIQHRECTGTLNNDGNTEKELALITSQNWQASRGIAPFTAADTDDANQQYLARKRAALQGKVEDKTAESSTFDLPYKTLPPVYKVLFPELLSDSPPSLFAVFGAPDDPDVRRGSMRSQLFGFPFNANYETRVTGGKVFSLTLPSPMYDKNQPMTVNFFFKNNVLSHGAGVDAHESIGNWNTL